MLKKWISWSDGNAGFLRAARDGNLSEVLEYLKGSTDINTSNPNGLNALHLASKEGHVNIVTELLRRGANVEAATKKGNTALHIASLAGHEDIIKILTENGARVNVQAQAGFTPLYMAAQEGHSEVLKFLLANGANQSLATEDGFTPLAVALQQGHDRVVSVLLEHDSKGKVKLPALHIAAKKDDVKSAALLLQNEQNNVNTETKSGFTPLHIASHYGNTNVANLLIQRGADVNFKAKNFITPLHVAARWGKANMVTLLLDHGANIDERTRDGLTPLHCAARSGHEGVVDLLLERGAPNSAKTKNGLTPLHMAAQGDHVDCARLLLYHKAQLDEITVDYLTPLHVAAHCGNVKTAKLLLDRKCEPNARALNGFTPLHIACKKNRIKVVELLLKYGASIEATTESGLTPLHVASFMGHMNIVIYLIQHNANPDTPTVRGETSLHLAARANQTDIIRILLRNGATVDATAREKQTPLHIAARLGNVDNVVLLLQHGASPDATTKDLYTPLHIAAKEGHEEVAQVLLDNGASHSMTTKKGFTPLHIAAKYGNIKVARLLLQKEANPDVQGKNGLTPLHVATHYNHVNVAQLLLEHKANPHSAAKNGYTPLHIAAKKNQMDIATTLLEYGAKPNAESKNGFTPLHLAAQEGHTDIVSLLLEHQANVNAKAHNGLTPMHLAAQEDKTPVAEILVKYMSEIDPTTKAGYTPLHTASHFGQQNMVRFLLDQKASVNATTKLGYTPLHQAAQQGHVQVCNMLLKQNASPNAVTNNGQTALAIAQKLGYISVVDTLQGVTEVQTIPATEDKYKVVSPETMQETLISDSEDEGGDDFLPQSPLFGKPLSEQHVYLPYYEGQKMQNREDSLSLERGGSISPLDQSFEKDYMEAQITSSAYAPAYATRPDNRYQTGTAPQGEAARYSSYSGSSFSTSFDPDNVPVDRAPVYSGFLISFMVDARGGAMRGCRHSGVRIIIPPRKASMPTRVTCRLLKKEKLMHPPSLNEGEGLAARILEMGPVATKFLGPIIIEVPHFASLRGKEREVVIMRSDNGKNWYEHPMVATEEAVNDALGGSLEGAEGVTPSPSQSGSVSSLWKLDQEEELTAKRITRILTTDFPQYFALVTKVRQENKQIGEEGGVISSTVVPQVQAVFPEGALTKTIRVGLQAQPIAPELVAKQLGNRVAVSPIVTVEPRRRKFHKPITLTIPVPKASQKGMINQYGGDRPTLRLLYSISGEKEPAVWEDITDAKPMSLVNDCVSFTTTVSARFWLIDCQNIQEATQMATALYKESIIVPYMAKFVIFAKRDSQEEGKLRMFCMTDDKVDKTLEKQEKFAEVARSRDIEVLEGRPQFVEMAGNLIPVTKSGDQLHVNFKSFRENRLPCTVKIRDLDQEPSARVAFMKEPKVARGEAPQSPICNLNITLPDMSKSESSLEDSEALEVRKRHSLLREHGIVVQDTVSRGQMKLTDIADTLQGDWVILAQQLDITMSEINRIKTDYNTVNDQALAMLNLWVQKNKEKATGNALESALRKINREDVAQKCMYDIETVEDEMEAAAARVAMDQSGFDTFKEEVGITKDSMKRGMSLDVQYDEQDLIKESESAAEESSPSSDRGSFVDRTAPKVEAEATSSRPESIAEEQILADLDVRRPLAKAESPEETAETSRKKKEAYMSLVSEMDRLADEQEALEKSTREVTEERHSVSEDTIVRVAKGSPEDPMQRVQQAQAQAPCVDMEPERSPTESSMVYKGDQEERITPFSNVEQAAARLAAEAEGADQSESVFDQVFDPSQSSQDTMYEEVLPDGTKVKHRKIHHQGKSVGARVMELVESEGPAHDREEVQEYEEVLPDGTVHHTHTVRKQTLKHVTRTLSVDEEEKSLYDREVVIPGSKRENMLETFVAPPTCVTEEEEVEHVLPDGKTVKRHVIMNRMVHHIKTHQQSFDEDSGKLEEEDYEIEEVIPGTVSAFIAGQDSESDDDELSGQMIADMAEFQEILDDGTVVTNKLLISEEKRTVRSRSGSIDESEESRRVEEVAVTPSPHPGSFVQGEAIPYDTTGHVPVQTRERVAHFEEFRHDGIVEDTLDLREDTERKGILQQRTVLDDTPDSFGTPASFENGAPDTPVITITEDLSTPPDEDDYISCYGIVQESDSKGVEAAPSEEPKAQTEAGKEVSESKYQEEVSEIVTRETSETVASAVHVHTTEERIETVKTEHVSETYEEKEDLADTEIISKEKIIVTETERIVDDEVSEPDETEEGRAETPTKTIEDETFPTQKTPDEQEDIPDECISETKEDSFEFQRDQKTVYDSEEHILSEETTKEIYTEDHKEVFVSVQRDHVVTEQEEVHEVVEEREVIVQDESEPVKEEVEQELLEGVEGAERGQEVDDATELSEPVKPEECVEEFAPAVEQIEEREEEVVKDIAQQEPERVTIAQVVSFDEQEDTFHEAEVEDETVSKEHLVEQIEQEDFKDTFVESEISKDEQVVEQIEQEEFKDTFVESEITVTDKEPAEEQVDIKEIDKVDTVEKDEYAESQEIEEFQQAEAELVIKVEEQEKQVLVEYDEQVKAEKVEEQAEDNEEFEQAETELVKEQTESQDIEQEVLKEVEETHVQEGQVQFEESQQQAATEVVTEEFYEQVEDHVQETSEKVLEEEIVSEDREEPKMASEQELEEIFEQAVEEDVTSEQLQGQEETQQEEATFQGTVTGTVLAEKICEDTVDVTETVIDKETEFVTVEKVEETVTEEATITETDRSEVQLEQEAVTGIEKEEEILAETSAVDETEDTVVEQAPDETEILKEEKMVEEQLEQHVIEPVSSERVVESEVLDVKDDVDAVIVKQEESESETEEAEAPSDTQELIFVDKATEEVEVVEQEMIHESDMEPAHVTIESTEEVTTHLVETEQVDEQDAKITSVEQEASREIVEETFEVAVVETVDQGVCEIPKSFPKTDEREAPTVGAEETFEEAMAETFTSERAEEEITKLVEEETVETITSVEKPEAHKEVVEEFELEAVVAETVEEEVPESFMDTVEQEKAESIVSVEHERPREAIEETFEEPEAYKEVVEDVEPEAVVAETVEEEVPESFMNTVEQEKAESIVSVEQEHPRQVIEETFEEPEAYKEVVEEVEPEAVVAETVEEEVPESFMDTVEQEKAESIVSVEQEHPREVIEETFEEPETYKEVVEEVVPEAVVAETVEDEVPESFMDTVEQEKAESIVSVEQEHPREVIEETFEEPEAYKKVVKEVVPEAVVAETVEEEVPESSMDTVEQEKAESIASVEQEHPREVIEETFEMLKSETVAAGKVEDEDEPEEEREIVQERLIETQITETVASERLVEYEETTLMHEVSKEEVTESDVSETVPDVHRVEVVSAEQHVELTEETDDMQDAVLQSVTEQQLAEAMSDITQESPKEVIEETFEDTAIEPVAAEKMEEEEEPTESKEVVEDMIQIQTTETVSSAVHYEEETFTEDAQFSQMTDVDHVLTKQEEEDEERPALSEQITIEVEEPEMFEEKDKLQESVDGVDIEQVQEITDEQQFTEERPEGQTHELLEEHVDEHDASDKEAEEESDTVEQKESAFSVGITVEHVGEDLQEESTEAKKDEVPQQDESSVDEQPVLEQEEPSPEREQDDQERAEEIEAVAAVCIPEDEGYDELMEEKVEEQPVDVQDDEGLVVVDDDIEHEQLEQIHTDEGAEYDEDQPEVDEPDRFKEMEIPERDVQVTETVEKFTSVVVSSERTHDYEETEMSESYEKIEGQIIDDSVTPLEEQVDEETEKVSDLDRDKEAFEKLDVSPEPEKEEDAEASDDEMFVEKTEQEIEPLASEVGEPQTETVCEEEKLPLAEHVQAEKEILVSEHELESESEDEAWEMLEKDELSQDELMAASDEMLMQVSVEEVKEEPETSEKEPVSTVLPEEEVVSTETTQIDLVVKTEHFEQITETTLESQLTKETALTAKEQLPDEELVERERFSSPVETEKLEDVQPGEPAQEPEHGESLKDAGSALDMSEVEIVTVEDNTSYQNRIDQGIVDQASFEMEGEPVEVDFKSGSSELSDEDLKERKLSASEFAQSQGVAEEQQEPSNIQVHQEQIVMEEQLELTDLQQVEDEEVDEEFAETEEPELEKLAETEDADEFSDTPSFEGPIEQGYRESASPELEHAQVEETFEQEPELTPEEPMKQTREEEQVVGTDVSERPHRPEPPETDRLVSETPEQIGKATPSELEPPTEDEPRSEKEEQQLDEKDIESPVIKDLDEQEEELAETQEDKEKHDVCVEEARMSSSEDEDSVEVKVEIFPEKAASEMKQDIDEIENELKKESLVEKSSMIEFSEMRTETVQHVEVHTSETVKSEISEFDSLKHWDEITQKEGKYDLAASDVMTESFYESSIDQSYTEKEEILVDTSSPLIKSDLDIDTTETSTLVKSELDLDTTETRPEPEELELKEDKDVEPTCAEAELITTSLESMDERERAESIETESVDSQQQVEQREEFITAAEPTIPVEAVPWTTDDMKAVESDEDFSDEEDLGASREPTSDSDTIPDDAKFDDEDVSPSKLEETVAYEEQVLDKKEEMIQQEVELKDDRIAEQSQTVKETSFESFSFTQKETIVEHATSYFSDEDVPAHMPDQTPEEKDIEDDYLPDETDFKDEDGQSEPAEEEFFIPYKQTHDFAAVTSFESSMTTSIYEPADLDDVQEPEVSESEQFVDRREEFTEEVRTSTDFKTEALISFDDKPEFDREDDKSEEASFEETFIDRKESFLEESLETIVSDSSNREGGGASVDIVGAGGESLISDQTADKAPSSEKAPSQGKETDRTSSPQDGVYLALHAPLLPSSSTEVQDRSGTPSDIEPDELDTVQEKTVVHSDSNERAVSPLEFSYEARHLFEESDITGASADDEMEPEGRITADTSQQIFIEQSIESRKPPKVGGYSSGDDDEDRPPSPSEFTLVQSHDQDMLMKALGIDQTIDEDRSSEEATDSESESEDDEDRPPSPTEFTLVASQDQDTLSKALVDESEPDYALQEEHLIYIQDADMPPKIGFGDDFMRDPLSDGFTTGTSSAEAPDASEQSSSEQAQKETLDQSVENNTMSTLSSELNEQPALEPSAPPMSSFEETSEEVTVMTSSYERLYQGINIETTTHSEQILDIGDHFDTKQPDLHFQPAGHSSSYEQLYQQGETTGPEEIPVIKTEQEEKLSSSSSEVAQLDDVRDQDAEKRETSEEKTEETDVEEQFSPLSKQQSPAKQALNLELDPQTPSFSFSDKSPDIIVSSQLDQGQQPVLSVPGKPLLVGPSPSDQLSTVLEGEEEDVEEEPKGPEEKPPQPQPMLLESPTERDPDEEIIETCVFTEVTESTSETRTQTVFHRSERESVEQTLQFSPDERGESLVTEEQQFDYAAESYQEMKSTVCETTISGAMATDSMDEVVSQSAYRTAEETVEHVESVPAEQSFEPLVSEQTTTAVYEEREEVETGDEEKLKGSDDEPSDEFGEAAIDRTETHITTERDVTDRPVVSVVPVVQLSQEQDVLIDTSETVEETSALDKDATLDKEEPSQQIEGENVIVEVKMTESIRTDSVDSTGEPEEETLEERETRLSYMAFDNMAFSAEDADKGAIAAAGKSKLQKQDTKEISPEDLEEKPWQFEFPDDFKQELDQRKLTQDELDLSGKEGLFAETTTETTVRDDKYETTTTTTTTYSHFECSTNLAESYHEQLSESYHETKPDLVSNQEEPDQVPVLLTETSETRVDTEIQPDILTDHEVDITSEVTEKAGIVPEPRETLPDDEPELEKEEEIPEDASSQSSSDRDNEVFDEASGKYVKIPWEVAHQFKRQFSESLLEQDKKLFKAQHSIDMGAFYRRDEKTEESVSSKHAQHRSETMDRTEAEEVTETRSMQRVTFQLSDDESVEYTEVAAEVFVEEVHRVETQPETTPIYEPHDMIQETHKAEVISSILESRQHVKEEIAKQGEEAEFEDEFAAQAANMYTEVTSQDIFSPSEDLMASYATAKSSLDSSIERSFVDAQYYMESSHTQSSKLSREDSTDSRDSKPDEELFPAHSFQPISVVSKESRLAQQELLQEMGDEKDRSLSPSVDSEELSTTYESQAELQEELGVCGMQHPPHIPNKFPMAVHSLGKALADNEIYESSETERDSTEEKLSPIEEAPTSEGLEEMNDEPSGKTEKRVTFQTDTLFARTQELHGGEDVKTSTSSSEVSMEPTLLAASYDLDTGHVSHVVAAYDISPDSVEKQTQPEAAPKAILSSPEDDVFETDGSLVTSEVRACSDILSDTKESGSDLYPSPPAPTPMDSSITDTACDLESASSKLEQIHDEQVEEELAAEAGHRVEEDELSETPKHTEEDEPSSPFEIMSPSELADVGLAAEVTVEGTMITSLESATSTSSYAEIDTEMVSSQGVVVEEEDIVEPMPANETVSMLNGPTEVEYHAEYDQEYPEQPPIHHQEPLTLGHDVIGQLQDAQLPVDDEPKGESFVQSTDELPQQTWEFSAGDAQPIESKEQEKDVTLTQGVMEELQPPQGQDQLTSSEQTLYGFEMPSEEMGALSVSTSFKESLGALEVDQDSEMTQPPTEITFQTDEALTEQEISDTKAPGPVDTEAKEKPSEPAEAKEDFDLPQGGIYPGKRALEIEIESQGAFSSEYASDMLGTEEQQQYFSASDSEDGLDEYVEQDEPVNDKHKEEKEILRYEDHYSMSKESEYKESVTTTVFTETIIQSSDIQDFVTEVQTETQGESEYAEKAEDELIRIDDGKPESEIDDSETVPAPLFIATEKNDQLDIQQDDLDRPISPTPDAVQQSYFGDEQDELMASELQAAEEEVLEKTASSFVESILDDVKQKVQDEKDQEYAEMEASAAVIEADEEISDEEDAVAMAADNGDVDRTDESEEELEVPPATPPPPIPPLPLFRKQVSEDIPEITITQHLHEERDEGDYPLCFAEKYTDKCIPERDDEEEEEPKQSTSYQSDFDQTDAPKVEESFKEEEVQEQEELPEEKEEKEISYPQDKDPFLVDTDSESTPKVLKDGEQQLQLVVAVQQSETVEAETGSTPVNEQDKLAEEFELRVEISDGMRPYDYAELQSPEDHGDSSSVDSFATVVAAQPDEDEDMVDEEQEDRLADFASMTSSFHSDMQPTLQDTGGEEDDDDEVEEEEPEEILEWPRRTYDRDGDRESESSLDSERYEFIDRTALSVITEMSDEDRFEMIEREEALSEGGTSDHVQSSPEGPQPSPGVNNYKFFGKSNEKDDVSISSSLLEFESLEKEINQSGSVSSIELGDKESLGGSLDERRFPSNNKNNDRDDASVASSLAEFERLERDIAVSGSLGSIEKVSSGSLGSMEKVSGSLGSIEKVTPESKSSNGAGSLTSLAEFEKYERECFTDSEDRRSSLGSMSRRSDASSHPSLIEFEHLEHEVRSTEELEVEAQKIVTILESGSLFAAAKAYSAKHDIDRDSLDGKESMDHDSLSEGEKADSLDGDTSELTDMTSSVIFTGIMPVCQAAGDATTSGGEFTSANEQDSDSLHGESVMQLSSDSLGLENRRAQRDVYDTDSLHETDGAMDRSADSIELGHRLETEPVDIMCKSADSIELERQLLVEAGFMQTSTDSLELGQPETVMERSTDSLEVDQKAEIDRDSLQGQDDLMLTSADSLEFDKSDKPPDVMQMSVESAAWSSMGSSGLSKSSQGTIRSQSDSSHSHDLMQVSAESAEFKYKHQKSEEKTQIIEESYTHKSESQTRTETTEVRHVTTTSYNTNPFLETEEECESYEQYNKQQNFKFDLEPVVSSSPFLSKGPYQEPKKVFTMAEWEAMKQSKKKQISSPEPSPPRDPAPTSSHPVSDLSSTPTSQPHIGLATSETSDSSRAAHGEEEEEGDHDLMEGDDSIGSMNSSLTTSVDGAESTKLMLKKEIHMKTTIGPDGREQTMVKEDIQVRQENDPPEELRDSMQEIINQFMVAELPQQRQALEDDV